MLRVPVCTECPEPGQLKELLQGSLNEGEQAHLVAHLDACEECQQCIEFMAAGGSGFVECARALRHTPTDATSAYWPALRKLERDVIHLPGNAGSVALARTKMSPDTAPKSPEIDLDFLDPAEEPGTLGKLGRFHVVEVVGRGGMGMVLRALDVCLQRQVALKVLDPQYAKSEVARERFIREARAAASIAHENVVAVHHVEKHRDNIPYLVMRLVNGQSLQELLDKGGPLEVREVVRIGKQVAAGLAAAHAEGLIHRDIKPANVLLEQGTGRVLLTDFGLAKAVEDTRLTQSGFVAGTPLYMSPEQARGEGLDHRSDLFSLGSVLYAMSTGHPPFQGSSPFVVLRQVTESEPKSIRDQNPLVPMELAAVIRHLLEKDPEKRIQSAAEVVELLTAVEAALPAEGVSESASRRLTNLTTQPCKRGHRLLYITSSILAALLLFTASEAIGWTHLTGIMPKPEPQPEPILTLKGGLGPIWSVAYAPDGSALAASLDDGSVKIWDPISGALKLHLSKVHKGPAFRLGYNFDGTRLATASDDGTVKLWNAKTGENIRTFPQSEHSRSLAFSPDGKKLALGTRAGVVKLLDLDSGIAVPAMKQHAGVVLDLCFSKDGSRLASASGDQTVKIWDVNNGMAEVQTIEAHGGVYTVSYHPDGQILAFAGWEGKIHLVNAGNGEEIGSPLGGHTEDVWDVAFSPDGKLLASVGEDRAVRLWDVASEKEVTTFHGIHGHTRTIYGIAMSKDGKTMASGSRDGSVKIWDISSY